MANLPAELKTRTYTATIDQDAARLLVTLSGASFVSKQNTFPGKVFGDTVTFDVGGSGFYYYYYGTLVREIRPNGQILGIFGTVTATALGISDRKIRRLMERIRGLAEHLGMKAADAE